MKQSELMALLVEAAQVGRQLFKQPDIGIGSNANVIAARRIHAIQCLLGDAVHGEHRETSRAVINSLYIQTLENRPERLPQLFPLFAVLCGDRSPEVWIGDVDWNIDDSAPPKLFWADLAWEGAVMAVANTAAEATAAIRDNHPRIKTDIPVEEVPFRAGEVRVCVGDG